MDTSSSGEGKPQVCQCQCQCQCAAPRSGGVRPWLLGGSPGWPISALCVLLSLSSVAVCLLMSLKTHQLESRLHMEMETEFPPSRSHGAFLNEDGTLVAELRTPIEKLVEEVCKFVQSC